MRFFLIKEDKKHNNRIQIKNNRLKGFEELDKVTVVNAIMPSSKQFTDIIFYPTFLIPEELYELVKLFEPWMEFKDVMLVNVDKSFMHLFKIPLLMKVDCLSENSVLNQDRSVIKQAILSKKNCLIQNYFLGFSILIDKMSLE